MLRLIKQSSWVFAALFTALASAPASSQWASDIDIYSLPPQVKERPNVLLVWDNSANWSSTVQTGIGNRTKFQLEQSTISKSIDNLDATRFRIGLMLAGEESSSSSGGYVRAAIRDLDATDSSGTTYKKRLSNLLGALDETGDKGSAAKVGMAMAEAYTYYAGLTALRGSIEKKRDYSGNAYADNKYPATRTASHAVYGFPSTTSSRHAFGSSGSTQYQSPLSANSCARNYIIFISNGPPSSGEDSDAKAALDAAYAHPTRGMAKPKDYPITGLTPSNQESNWGDEWARFMKMTPQAITTFTIDVNPDTNVQGRAWSAALSSMAGQSGGEYFKVDASVDDGKQLAIALSTIFNQIQSVDSVFASASLPVSVNSRGTYLNQVFIGMFRPDGLARPRWNGNLKQYQFGYNDLTNTLSLVDANKAEAIGDSGFISRTATSFWTTSSDFWKNQPAYLNISPSDAPDGFAVEKGGAAQRLREDFSSDTLRAQRNVLTCVGCAPGTVLGSSSATRFDTSNLGLTLSSFGMSLLASVTEKNALIEWVRGKDNYLVNGTSPEYGPGSPTTVRPSIHGDVLHSRPAVVNYGGTTGVVVFYGANDGTLRAVDGSQDHVNDGGGKELWSFIPQEKFGHLNRLRTNSPDIRLSTTSMPTDPNATAPTPRDYFFDGPITVYQKYNSNGDTEQVIIYAGMRRGGRQLYAFDVTTPTAPKFLFKVTDSGSFAELGQTWSEARPARLKGYTEAAWAALKGQSGGSDAVRPVLIMGGGYDAPAEDAATPGTVTMGNYIYVIDALDGTYIAKLPTTRSVPGDVTLIDADNDGYVDRAYAADTGGNVYRLYFESSAGNDRTRWGIFPIAQLGDTTNPRKFFYAPDVVMSKGKAIVLVGSGDREKPLQTTGSDRFFTLFDNNTVKGAPSPLPTTVKPSDLGVVGTDTANAPAGCYISLATGEKVVNAATTAGGMTYFGTNQPSSASGSTCNGSLGVAKAYAAPLYCKAFDSMEFLGGGLPPSPVSGLVTVTYTSQRGDTAGQQFTRTVPFIIGAPNPKRSAIEGGKLNPPIKPTRSRKYWFQERSR
ncbi:hypothetical protein JI739_21025 [Ramlibacter sp. AW1]|uniref:VWFA domain-containing protein n=1 Tax=Ramlibacter aurantiacus TaxID=2801330 RepID=A0A936ZL11_9BURK|nr:PilC/PilY family type IV pilus protein [Ramlibacter aurantiacus]MBL0422832.1 hypothetical protein [Ramlibacter aurantiacus]